MDCEDAQEFMHSARDACKKIYERAVHGVIWTSDNDGVPWVQLLDDKKKIVAAYSPMTGQILYRASDCPIRQKFGVTN